MAILQKLVSHGGKRLSLYADKGCHLRKMAALLFPEESSTILRLLISPASFQKLTELYQKSHPSTEPTENGRRFDAKTDPAD